MVATPYSGVGIAAYETGERPAVELFNSALPHPVTEDFGVPENTEWPAYTVVGLGADDMLAMGRTSGATPVVPIGVTSMAVKTGAGQTDRMAVYRAGNFNPDALTWHADYDTDAKKADAFRGSPAPTNIVIRQRL